MSAGLNEAQTRLNYIVDYAKPSLSILTGYAK